MVLRCANADLAHHALQRGSGNLALLGLIVGVRHLQQRGVVEARVVPQEVEQHLLHGVAGAQVGAQRLVGHFAGHHLLYILLRGHFAGVFDVAGYKPIGHHAAQVVALHELLARFIKKLGNAQAAVAAVHANVGPVERIAAGIMRGKGAAACDLFIGVGLRVILKLHNQRGGIAHHFAVQFGQNLPLGKGGPLQFVEAHGVVGAFVVVGVGGAMAGQHRGDVVPAPRAHLDALLLPPPCHRRRRAVHHLYRFDDGCGGPALERRRRAGRRCIQRAACGHDFVAGRFAAFARLAAGHRCILWGEQTEIKGTTRTNEIHASATVAADASGPYRIRAYASSSHSSAASSTSARNRFNTPLAVP